MNQAWLKHHAVSIVALCVCIFFTASGGSTLMDIMQPHPVMTPKKEAETKMSQKHTVQLSDYALFGEYLSANQSQAIPSTLLNISLVGILKGNTPGSSQALIKVGNNDEKLYFINDNLPGGAVLIRILDDHVLIRRASRIERLALPKDILNADAKYPAL